MCPYSLTYQRKLKAAGSIVRLYNSKKQTKLSFFRIISVEGTTEMLISPHHFSYKLQVASYIQNCQYSPSYECKETLMYQ